jgi:hypothetical protein
MTTFRATLETYKKGETQQAYNMFKNDPNANKDTSFKEFCKGMETVLKLKNSKTTTLQ